MPERPLNWLSEAIGRHLVLYAQRWRRETGDTNPFVGPLEHTVTLILDRVLNGLGYCTYTERAYPGSSGRNIEKIDLWAQGPSGGNWLAEVKQIWDWDQRLNEKRFHSRRDLLRDFDRLRRQDLPAHSRKLVLWVVYSNCGTGERRPQGSKRYKLGDITSIVEAEANVRLEGDCIVSFEEHCKECRDDCKFAHVLCWTVE